MDVVDAWADFAGERVVQVFQELHAGTCCLDGGDIGIQCGNRVDDLAELGVAQVGVDLRLWLRLQRDQTEGAHGPIQVGSAVGFAQWQQLTQGWLVDLDDVDASVFQVSDFVGKRDTDLVGGDGLVDVVTNERPRQDSHRTSQHALDVLVGQRLCVLRPLGGHGLWARNVTDDDWWTGATGTVGLYPAVFGDHETVEKLREVLHHVVTLWLAVYQHVDAQVFLQLDHGSDLAAQLFDVLLVGELAGAVIGTRTTDLLGLWERTNGGGWQLRQTQFILDLDALCELRLAGNLAFWQLRDALGDGVVVGALGFFTGAQGALGAGEGLLYLVALAVQGSSNGHNLGDLLVCEGEPASNVDRQVLFCLNGVWHVLQRNGGGDVLGAEFFGGFDQRVEVTGPDVAAINHTSNQGGLWRLGNGFIDAVQVVGIQCLGRTGNIHLEGLWGGGQQLVQASLQRTVRGGQVDLRAVVVTQQLGPDFTGALGKLGIRDAGVIGNQGWFCNLDPFHASFLQCREDLCVGFREVIQAIQRVGGAVGSFG